LPSPLGGQARVSGETGRPYARLKSRIARCRHLPPVSIHTLDRLIDVGLALSFVAVPELYEVAFGNPNPQSALAAFLEFLSDHASRRIIAPRASAAPGHMAH
jgi:hypothetical protein